MSYTSERYNFKTIKGYSTNEIELTDFSNDISDYNFYMEYFNKNNANTGLFIERKDLTLVSGSIKIESYIETYEVGTYDYIISMEKENEKRILLMGTKTVINDI